MRQHYPSDIGCEPCGLMLPILARVRQQTRPRAVD
jgi:hypothetical protein